MWVIRPEIVGVAEFSIHMGICWKPDTNRDNMLGIAGGIAG